MTAQASQTVKLGLCPLIWTEQYGANKGAPERQIAGLRRAMTEMAGTGIAGITADLFEGLSCQEFRELTGNHGFVAAPAYFSGAFEASERYSEILESARQVAGEQAALGLSTIFIASNTVPERYIAPAQGAHANNDRLRRIADGLVAAAEIFHAHGIEAGLHQHVGSWVETDEETRSVLEWTKGSVLGFGPDTGHLFWVDADLPDLLTRYRDRIVGLHVKDIHLRRIHAARAAHADFGASMRQFGVVTEAGRGDIDFDGVFAALGPVLPSWIIIDVDVAELTDLRESTLASRDFLLPYVRRSSGWRDASVLAE